MGRLNVALLRYLSKDEFRVLTAIEMGMKNHEVVPLALMSSVAGISVSQCQKIAHDLVKHKLCNYEHKKVLGYKLTFMGYDFLALRALTNRSVVHSFGSQIGVGKESDIYAVTNEDNVQYAMKIHRLGRISFRKVKEKRDYLCHRRNTSWIYMSRLAANVEYKFMKALHERGLPVPAPLDCNRHCVVMELVDGYPLHQVHSLSDPEKLYNELMNVIVKFAEIGLIHCDFNEFNIMLCGDDTPVIIDFPQMISTAHANADWHFNRDVECICEFFNKRFSYTGGWMPQLIDIVKKESVDCIVNASGYSLIPEEQVSSDNDDSGDSCDSHDSNCDDIATETSPRPLPGDHTPDTQEILIDSTSVRELVKKKISRDKHREGMRGRKKHAKNNITPSGRRNGKQKNPSLQEFWDY